VDVPGWRRRGRWRIGGWAGRLQLQGRLQGGDFLRLLRIEPFAMFREFAFEGLVQTGLLHSELLPELLQGVLHIVCKRMKLVRNWLRALTALIPLIKSDLP
jgi:hypothetical protein